jgi:hypothetical protein
VVALIMLSRYRTRSTLRCQHRTRNEEGRDWTDGSGPMASCHDAIIVDGIVVAGAN